MDYNQLTPESPLGDREALLTQQPIDQGVQLQGGPSGEFVILYAGGYDPYLTHEIELARIKKTVKDPWVPSSQDFLSTALRTTTGKILSAKEPAEFFERLAKFSGMINHLMIIGHGINTGGIGLAGSIIALTTNECISEYTLKEPNNLKLTKEKIRSKFLKGAVIDLLACNINISSGFKKTMEEAFGVKVRNLSGPVYWIIRMDKKQDKIIEKDRGLLCLKFNSDGKPVKVYQKATELPFK
jgi:hypothetical protein